MEIRYGTLVSVYGTPVRREAYTFMPADVVLDGSAFSLDFELRDHLEGEVPVALRFPLHSGIEAAWVRARIPRLFGFTPEAAGVEKALLCTGFATVTPGGSVCYPFLCTDHYGRAALMFSDDGPEMSVKRAVAKAFWGALLQDPDDLADFEERVYHPGAGVWLSYGCEGGRVYCDEEE